MTTKATRNRLVHVLHRRLNNGDVTAMFKRTLVAVAVGIMAAFALAVMIAWGLR